MKEYPLANLTEQIIGSSIEVHRELGPGLLESAYEECLSQELSDRGIEFERQIELPILYKQKRIEATYRIDLLVEGAVVVELKSVKEVSPIHEAQLLTYMKLAKKRVGLLINFNTELLKNGVTRRVI